MRLLKPLEECGSKLHYLQVRSKFCRSGPDVLDYVMRIKMVKLPVKIWGFINML